MNSLKKKIYCIGIGGIGVSALARYYLSEGYQVFGSDRSDSELIRALKEEGCDIIIGSDSNRIDSSYERVIHTEAIPKKQEELLKAQELLLPLRKYSEALGEIANQYKLIAVTGTHGKSTTSSMISQILLESKEDFVSVVGTILKEFGGKNFYIRGKTQNYCVIEACEYKEHFLAYRPLVAVITNIEYDHADYFKTPLTYIQAFEKFIDNILPGGFCILSGEDAHSQKLIGKREDIHYIVMYEKKFIFDSQDFYFPEIVLHVSGDHILFDAKLAYIVGHIIGIDDITILETLENYAGVWRRMEKIGHTPYGNMLMSDYAHHPTEILTTLKALKQGYPDKKLFVIFQPHQYSRTLELLNDFIMCFRDADTLIIPDIYESRDTLEDKKKINTSLFVEKIQHDAVYDGKGLENALSLIEKYDSEHPNSNIILLLGAGNIDTLRYKIKTS